MTHETAQKGFAVASLRVTQFCVAADNPIKLFSHEALSFKGWTSNPFFLLFDAGSTFHCIMRKNETQPFMLGYVTVLRISLCNLSSRCHQVSYRFSTGGCRGSDRQQAWYRIRLGTAWWILARLGRLRGDRRTTFFFKFCGWFCRFFNVWWLGLFKRNWKWLVPSFAAYFVDVSLRKWNIKFSPIRRSFFPRSLSPSQPV